MSINSIGYSSSPLGASILNLNNQLSDLQTQLSTGKKSTTYSGLGSNEGFAIAARAQLANITGYSGAITNVTTSITAANNALQTIVNLSTNVQNAITTSSPALTSSGQTASQGVALSQLSTLVDVLNTQVGDRYLFSGSATDTPSVAPADAILNGSGTQAGLKQIISERLQADTGASGLGRVAVTSPNPTQVTVSEEAAGLPFGLKLTAVSSSLTNGGTVTPLITPTPALGDPTAQNTTIDLGATNPADGDQVTLTFGLPDGTSQSIKLTASSTVPAPAGSFAIGADSTATAVNLKSAITSSIQSIVNTSLPAASAIAASNNFFSSTPQRVSGTPLNTATTLVNATSANTVSWYTGEPGSGSARASSIARIDQSVTVQYGARANEDAIRSQLQSIAVLAAFTASPTDPNATAQVAALNQSVGQNLAVKSNQQSIQDIQTDFATAQTAMKDASARQAQSQTLLQNVVDQTESVSSDDVISKILALQTNLQASYQTTSILSQLSLVKFLPT